MYKYKERVIIFNGIQLSETGFKDLRFETSRFADGLNTIRGFGAQLNESNLSVVDTISVDFILKTEELSNLAYIYSMFKALGVLPIENEYLVNKISDTISGGNDTVKEFSHLLCFLERLQVTSLEKTSNGYDVNMILTLYQHSFTEDLYKEFENKFKQWDSDTNFSNICKTATSEFSNQLSSNNTSDLNLFIYNVEKLNAYYKQTILDTAKVNNLLNGKDEAAASIEENKRLNYLRTKIEPSELYKPASIKIENKHILQIELITTNMISNFPMKGKPIGYKSYLGIGKSTFGIKMIFNEDESDIVQSIKRVSDKNIIDHKFMLDHPLAKLFDFHSSDITNVTFNNIEAANGIVVTMVFNISGFKYDKDEEIINTSDIIVKKQKNEYTINEYVGGLYLEHLANHIVCNQGDPNMYSLLPALMDHILESKATNSFQGDTGENESNSYIVKKYFFIDLLSSYSSLKTSFGYHSSYVTTDVDFTVTTEGIYDQYGNNSSFFNNNILQSATSSYLGKTENGLNTLFDEGEAYNEISNKNSRVKKLLTAKNRGTAYDVFELKKGRLNQSSTKEDDTILFPFLDLKNASQIYSYLDTVAIYQILSSYEDNKIINELFFKPDSSMTGEIYPKYLMEELVNPLGIELFNERANPSLEHFGICSKPYEEFYYRLFDICMNMSTVSEIINELKNPTNSFIYSEGIDFNKVHNYINDLSTEFLKSFVRSFQDEQFIERIIKEVNLLCIENVKKDKDPNAKEHQEYEIEVNKEFFTEKLNEIYNEVNHQFNSDKEEIINRLYNIFLTKLNYYLLMYIKGNKVKELDKNKIVPMDAQIKILLLSSTFFAPLFLYNKYRTDSFGKAIIIGMQNIGTKIMEYNKNLNGYNGKHKFEEDNPMFQMFKINNKDDFDTNNNKNIYQLFPTLFGKKIPYSYYFNIVQNSSFIYGSKYVTYDDVLKKDCLYFYGQKIPRYDIHNEISKILQPKDDKEAIVLVSDFLERAKKSFVDGNKYSTIVPKTIEMADANLYDYIVKNYGFFAIQNINRYHYSDIASYYKDLFLDYSDPDDTKLNENMKARLIGHNDMFYNFDNVSKVITGSLSDMVPDYIISIIKRPFNSEFSGEINKFVVEEYELLASNVNSISITKDPKTKIKTAVIEITNISKHVFNVKEDGSFNVKEISDGNVEVMRIDSGDEIRIKLGYTNNSSIFNGVISNINYGNNLMVLTCSSFCSALYGYNLPELNSSSHVSLLNRFVKSVRGIYDANLRFDEEKQTSFQLYNHFKLKHPNFHLFDIFRARYNNFAEFISSNDKREPGMFMTSAMSLLALPNRIVEKFTGRLTNITSNKLLNTKIVSQDLKNPLGSVSAQDDMTTGNVVNKNIIKNLNNVDNDYETYGIMSNIFDNNNTFSLSNSGEIKYSYNPPEDSSQQNSNQGNNSSSQPSDYSDQIEDSIHQIMDEESLLTTFPCSTVRITALKGEPRSGNREHKGIDIASEQHNPEVVRAAGDGQVVNIYNGLKDGGGRQVKIRHKINRNGKEFVFYTYYMHLEKIFLTEKKEIKAGDPIGIMGGSGNGSLTEYIRHLHFEVRASDGKTRLNPLAKNILPKFNLIFKKGLTGERGQYA